MGCGSVLLHLVAAAIIVVSGSSEKPAKVYRVEVKYLQPKTEQAEEVRGTKVIEPVWKEEIVPESPQTIDLTEITPISLDMAKQLEEAMENADIVETPVPPVENAIITPGGGLGSGADTEDGGGDSLLASGTESGWGGEASGDGWGGGSGSPGIGGGTGGGYGSGTGNSLGRAGASGDGTGVYFAGMPGIIPPVYDRTPQPSYPAASRSRSEQGTVVLRVEVLINGRVGQAEVMESSSYGSLDEAALKAVKNWRFKPATMRKEPVICWARIPIRFELR